MEDQEISLKEYFEITILHRNILSDMELIICPLIDVLNNKHVKSNYKLWLNDPEVTEYNSHGLFPFNPLTDAENYATTSNRIAWAILCMKEKNSMTKEYPISNLELKHIGNVVTDSIDFIHRSGEITCVIGEPNYWNKGIMSWAVELMCLHCFVNLGLNRIWSGTTEYNIGMQKVFEKLGFKKEGIFRQGMWLHNKFVDVITYGLLKQELILNNKSKQKGELKKVTETINKVESIRKRNNTNWMDLVKLAFRIAPKEAKKIITHIVECDKEITNTLQTLMTKEK